MVYGLQRDHIYRKRSEDSRQLLRDVLLGEGCGTGLEWRFAFGGPSGVRSMRFPKV